MDQAILSRHAGGHHLGAVDGHAALHGFNPAALDVLGHHFDINHVVRQDFGESPVSWRKHSKWTSAPKRVDQTSSQSDA